MQRDAYVGIEGLKNGLILSTKYEVEQRVFDNPSVVVLTNSTPFIKSGAKPVVPFSQDRISIITLSEPNWELQATTPYIVTASGPDRAECGPRPGWDEAFIPRRFGGGTLKRVVADGGTSSCTAGGSTDTIPTGRFDACGRERILAGTFEWPSKSTTDYADWHNTGDTVTSTSSTFAIASSFDAFFRNPAAPKRPGLPEHARCVLREGDHDDETDSMRGRIRFLHVLPLRAGQQTPGGDSTHSGLHEAGRRMDEVHE